MSVQPQEEKFEVPPKQQDQQPLTNEQKLIQQNIMLKNVIQGLITMLDKVSRSQSTVLAQIGTINNSLEQILQNLPKQQE